MQVLSAAGTGLGKVIVKGQELSFHLSDVFSKKWGLHGAFSVRKTLTMLTSASAQEEGAGHTINTQCSHYYTFILSCDCLIFLSKCTRLILLNMKNFLLGERTPLQGLYPSHVLHP